MPTENIVPEPSGRRDLTIVTVLRDGRHLTYSNLVRDHDRQDLMVAVHCAARRVYHDDILHFVVLAGTDAERILPEVPRG